MKQVTIQGEPGCFHEEAARRYLGDEPIEIVPCRTFEAQFERMRHEGSLLGIVAIENTIAGSLLQNHELLRRRSSANANCASRTCWRPFPANGSTS